MDMANATARDLGIQHRRYDQDYGIESYERGVGGWLTVIRGAETTYEDIFLPLHGRYQLTNLAMAIASAEALVGRKLDVEAVRDAAAVATAPGRMEPLASSPFVMVDGAHNADGVESLVESIREEYPNTRWHLVLGIMGDKNVELMVEYLSPIVKGVITTAVDNKRAVPAVELAERVSRVIPDVPVLPSERVDYGLDMARAEAGVEGAVLVTGSIYLVGEVRDLLT
jgi:dihydrofolate synthase/folylpolyglutamate synthase